MHVLRTAPPVGEPLPPSWWRGDDDAAETSMAAMTLIRQVPRGNG